MNWNPTAQGSRWREFQFALHQAQQAIAPEVKLEYALQHWNEIAAALAERDRKRVPQLAQCHVLS